MLNFDKLKLILKEVEEKELFNDFFISLFDYKKEDINKLIIRYYFDNGFIVDIFDYNYDNSFFRYYFSEYNEVIIIDKNVVVNNISLKEMYINKDNSKFYLFSSLFYEKDKKTKINNLNKLFNKKIVNIFLKLLEC